MTTHYEIESLRRPANRQSADLPAPWYDYPVLQSGEYRTEILYTNGRDYVKVHIGQQDGVWVAATTWMIGGSSRGCHPGRKWGEFASEQNALLWAFGELLAEEGVLPPARDQDP